MFGYVKAFKPELKMREFERYRSVYCGLCKAISSEYGQVPRLAVSYDLTFLLLLVQALGEASPVLASEACVLHPFRKHPIGKTDEVLRVGAAVAVLLASSKLDDNVADGEHRFSTFGLRLLTARAVRKAKRLHPDLSVALASALAVLSDLEAAAVTDLGSDAVVDGASDLSANLSSDATDDRSSNLSGRSNNTSSLVNQSKAFGSVLKILSDAICKAASLGTGLIVQVGFLFYDLGAWVYLMDALDDFDADLKARGRSFIPAANKEAAVALVEPLLLALEERMEKTAALLPYQRDASIVANVLLDGLPLERQRLVCSQCGT